MLVHRKEQLDRPIGLPGRNVPLGDDCKGFRGRTKVEGAHLCHKRPGRSVVPEASSKVNGMVEGRGSGGEMGTSKELAEKLEGFWSVVPEPF